jgi:GGDEF domain-containing protein
VAVFPADGTTVADLLAVADREMYAAKASRSLR